MNRNSLIFSVIVLIISVASAAAAGYFYGFQKGAGQAKNGTVDQGAQEALPQGSGPNLDELKSHTVYLASSADGKAWKKGSLVQRQASVPDLIQLSQDIGKYKKGDLLVYFVDFSTLTKNAGSEQLGLISSSDGGKTWSKKVNIKISNQPNKGAAVDPSLVQLSDGRLRLYFFGSEVTQGDPAKVEGEHKVYSAVSINGINFKTETGARFAAERLTDPEVIFYKGSWYMYWSNGQNTKLAISSDGLPFTEKEISGGDVGGVPGALATSEGGVRLFGCKRGGIATAVSTDGTNFKPEQEGILNGCDPAPIRLGDGTYLMVFKEVEMPQGQKPPTP